MTKISLTGKEKLALLSNFSTMIGAGIPILETVDSLMEDSKGNQLKFLESVKADLTQGQHLYTTLQKFPNIFDQVSVNIVKASEEAGTLDVALNDLKDSIKKDMEFSDRIKAALMYPIFIVFVFIAVMLMILVVVVPKISTVFLRLNVELPLPTRLLILASNTLLENTIVVIAVGGAFLTGLFYLIKKQRKHILNLAFHLPVISQLAKEIDLTRFTHSLNLLLSAGIPITSALELARSVVLKKEIYNAITHTQEVVASGRKLSEGLKNARHEIGRAHV